ncbi:phosphoenolpyruvate synthase [Thiomonas arsenitoxydans]|uniref:Phosphoenolpyruvate synthase n=1 Tax=Thiomonas arsenitoxydans (strain DSM 22701 / CIP 110005 / 3As) TaxID=426114 RepID=D6CUW2_THIA3|nr:phosphoenolpyruvate synthase [Thiomonas arsenitoxydans]CAZ89081.1 Phosphoenolpyruvate synthase (Pyruvate, water dikinase) (PEP synthase) [Thiomonas arsenitoxydans]CQR36488.1 phosphoenolpyruvate synthase [Thiomonas arsenitoxydans]CQR36527.1 phosphoenolpyruvate synthase [Thiomonas arsenitoxydans]CQR37377.1 phosphoenolpyruvate synthase [Thiomonas arsenitoxydans]CQR38882.1 phosphoenolpyruvate synthase [Thiomonas arsenitoxydans]
MTQQNTAHSGNELILQLDDVRMSDIDQVGGKNASLGEMISQLSGSGVRVPGGFATTAHAFRQFLRAGGLGERIETMLKELDADDVRALERCGAQIRQWVIETPFPADLEQAIRGAYADLTAGNPEASFAVRSSATAEDLPDASFAGQQESYLNVSGIDAVLEKIKHVFASLYNDRAISYRVHKGFVHSDVALSAGVQRMVRSDKAVSGVMFTLDTESGFPDVVFITASYGLGETVVQGAVNPDEFYVFKPTLKAGKEAVIRRNLGSKLIRMEFAPAGSPHLVQTVDTPSELRNRYCLTDAEAQELARFAMTIEAHYQRPMDIEWGKDGIDGHLYILQARPETVKSNGHTRTEQRYTLKGKGAVLVTGRAIGQKIGAGPVRVVHSITDMHLVQAGDVLVTDMTDPNWEPVMKKASAIVTNRGGRTCHAAIIARELGIPAVVGCGHATDVLKDDMLITVSCAQGDTGQIYDGLLETEVTEVARGAMPEVPTKIMMNVGNPTLAFDFSQVPNQGVGLARLEFIINNNIGVHPRAVLEYPNVDSDLKKAVESVARGHVSPRAFYVDKLAEGIATIAAAFYPKPVIVRLSDFKSNEYKKLIGGSRYEPDEENPMLGFRGASRYVSPDFAQSFEMECVALKRVREQMGLDNVEIMVPFVRTLGEAEGVINLLGRHGLKRGENGLRIIMMCEVPSNAVLAKEFLQYFDGFSIGSNDLTQLTLGLDRDSGLVAQAFDERDPAVKVLLAQAIAACRAEGKYVGICGQGPSDHPDLAQWLMEQGISSISLNPDTVIATWQQLAKH